MSKVSDLFINGKFLYYAFLAGSGEILRNQIEINRINVFPVNDKDTGSNLASTVRSVLSNIKPDKSYFTTINNIAEAAMIGARGNSGVIFAQFLYGVSRETKSKDKISLFDFAESIINSIPYIYEAIANPVEGTMLTVIKEWADFLNSQKMKAQQFKSVIINSLEVLEQSLLKTTQQLEALSKHGFVDAGAKGFVLFIKGIINFIKHGNIRVLYLEANQSFSLIHTEGISSEEITERFCTEAVIRNLKIGKAEFQKILSENASSVVVAGSDKLCRIHVHTNNPAQLFHKIKDFGTITYQKADDMVRQRDAAFDRKWNIALVTDSTCDLPQELIDFYQINFVPINLNFGENHYLDKVSIQPEQFYDLLETSDEFPKTSQINEYSFTYLYSHLASHYDAIVSVHLTSQFSGTFENSRKAAQKIEKEFNKPVKVFDSKNLSGALGLLVLKAAQKIESGASVNEIMEMLEYDVKNTMIFVSVRDLKYMIKGGRVSRKKGIIAGLLGLKPVISMDENGKSKLFGKAFSQKSNLKKIYNHIKDIKKDKMVWNYIILHAHNFEGANEAAKAMFELTGIKEIGKVNISPVIGMHAGIGSVAVSVLLTK